MAANRRSNQVSVHSIVWARLTAWVILLCIIVLMLIGGT